MSPYYLVIYFCTTVFSTGVGTSVVSIPQPNLAQCMASGKQAQNLSHLQNGTTEVKFECIKG